MRGSKRYSVSKQEEKRNRHNSATSSSTSKHNKTSQISWKQIAFICLPLCDVFVLIATLLTCYYYTKQDEQSSLLFPNELSKTDPARAIFSTGVSLSAILSLLVTFLKYKQIGPLFNGPVNQLACASGVISATSQFMVANVPTKENLVIINIVAVSVYLVFTILYCCMHTYLTRNTPALSSKFIFITRVLVLEFALLSSAVLSAFLVPELSHWNRTPSNVAQTASWCCLAFVLAYKVTFVNDLKQMYFRVDILISSSHTEAIYKTDRDSSSMETRLLFNDDTESTRVSTRSKKSRSSMSEVNTVFNYPATRKSSV